MKNPKLVVGHIINDQLFFKSVKTSKRLDWLKQLDPEELVEFLAELFKLVTQISEGKKGAETLSVFLSEWHETALLNSEPEILEDILEAEKELTAGGGKAWSLIKKEIDLLTEANV